MFFHVHSGLELSLNLKTPKSVGHRSVCGILMCEEHLKVDKSNSSAFQLNFVSMSIFSSSVRGNKGGNANPLATLTLERPHNVSHD